MWALALAAEQGIFDSDRADYERMVLTFTLKQQRPRPAARASVGRPAPGFDLPGPGRGHLSLDRIRGPVVINFFATWCPSCRQEMPLLQARADQLQGRLSVVGIDTHDDPGGVPAFLKYMGARFPVGYDSNGEVADRYQVGALPVTFFLDSRHVLRTSVVGPVTADSLARGLKEIGL